MLRYRFNTRLIVVSAVAILLLAVGTHFVHAWQMRRHAHDQLARANAAEQAGNPTEAVASLNRSLAFQAANHAVRVRQARLLGKNATTHRQRLKAFAALKAVVPAHGGDLAVRLEAVDVALAANAADEAVRFLRPAIEEYPDRADLHERYAQAQEAAGKFADAIDSLEKTLELDAARPRAAESLARLYKTKLDQPRRAVGVLDRLVLRNPNLAGAYRVRGQDRMMRGQLESANSDLETARQLNDKRKTADRDDRDPEIFAVSAELAQRRGQNDQARQFWEQAVALAPDRLPFVLGLVRTCREQGKTGEAIEVANRGLASQPGDPELSFLLADLLLDKGDLAASERLSAKLPETMKGRKLYLSGRSLLVRQLPAAAIATLVKAHAEKDLPSGMAATALVKAFGDVGRYADQLAAAREATRLASTPDSRAELARVLTIHGRGNEAFKDLRQLAELPVPPERVWAPLARVLLEQNMQKPNWQRNWDEVEKLLDRADRVPSDAASAALLRSDMLILRDRPQDALTALTAARKKHPHEPILWQAEAALTERLGQAAKAQSLLAEADRVFSDRLDWQTTRAWRLVNDQGTGAAAALEDLERKSTDLTAEDRDRLTRTLAELHARLGNYPEVERLCGLILHGDPTDIASHLLLAEARQHRGDAAGAEKLLEALQKIEGPGGVSWRCGRATFLMARSESKSLGEARKLLAEAARIRPNWSYPLILLGRLADRELEPALALAHYQRVLALGDYRPEAVRRVVALLLEQDRTTEADRVMDRAEKAGTLDRDLWRPAAETALRAGRFDRATTLARQVVGQERTSRDLLWLGRILSGAGRNLEAEEILKEAVQQAPNSTAVWLALIGQYTRAGKSAAAESALIQLSARLAPDRVALVRGRAYEIMGRTADAEKSYRQFVSKHPREADGLNRLAELYLRTNQPSKAERVLMAMLDPRVLVPEEELPEIRRRLALAITAPDRGEERIAQALALLALNRDTEGENEADKRTAALVTGMRADERRDAIETLEALPGGPAVSVAEHVRLAHLYEEEGNWPGARKQYLALLAKDRSNTAIMALLIEGLLRQNKRAEAAQWIEALKKLEPKSLRTLQFEEQLRKPKAKEKVEA